MSKLVNIKTAVNELFSNFEPNLTLDEVQKGLLEVYPHLSDYSAFNNLTKLYMTESGYIFKQTTRKAIAQQRKEEQELIDSNKRTDLVIEQVITSDIDVSKMKTYKTGTAADMLFSNFGGIMGGTQYEVSAAAGTGKTTLLAQLAKDLERNNTNYKALFISGEMDRDDWEIEVYQNPSLSGLDTLFLLDLDEEIFDIRTVLLNALKHADFVIVDSSSAIVDLLLEQGHKKTEVERWLRKNIIKISKEQRSTIMVIKHVNKDGEAAGSTKDKHMFTGKLNMEIGSDGRRCIYFDKNRRGGNNQKRKLYFTKDKTTGRLVFDVEQFSDDTTINEIIETTKIDKSEQDSRFGALLANIEDNKFDSGVKAIDVDLTYEQEFLG